MADFIDTPLKHYSTGMQMRLAFAVAAHFEPQILLVDEVLAVGDLAFQKKCLGKMGEVAHAGRTVILVSHNMGAIGHLCRRCLLLEKAGKCLIPPPKTPLLPTSRLACRLVQQSAANRGSDAVVSLSGSLPPRC